MSNKNEIVEVALKYPEITHDDSGEYPSEESLDFIEKFECHKYGWVTLVEFIESIWWAADWGFKFSKKKYLQLHTGGWSGNEDIIYSLQMNFTFWGVCWKKSVRGGHYYFELPKIPQQ